MSYAAYVDRAYSATRATAAELRERQCQWPGCCAPEDETERCSVCSESFCPDHMIDGLCPKCDLVDAAAEALIRQIDRRAA